MSRLSRPTSPLALVAALALTVAACSGERAVAPAGDATPSSDIRSVPLTPAVRQFEIDYMKFAINHHAMGVIVATGCRNKAVLDDLRVLCARVVEAQLREIRMLQAWLRDWYGINYLPRITAADLVMIRHLGALRGTEFDIEFMQMLSMHHVQIIQRSVPVLHGANHRPLQAEIAAPVIENQSREIAEMRSWLCIYYDLCEGLP